MYACVYTHIHTPVLQQDFLCYNWCDLADNRTAMCCQQEPFILPGDHQFKEAEADLPPPSTEEELAELQTSEQPSQMNR